MMQTLTTVGRVLKVGNYLLIVTDLKVARGVKLKDYVVYGKYQGDNFLTKE